MAPPSVSRRATPAPAEPVTGIFGFSTLPALLCFGGLWFWLLLAPSFWSGNWMLENYADTQSLVMQSLVLLCGAGLATLAAVSRVPAPKFGATAWLLLLFLGWMLLTVFTASYRHDAWIELSQVTGALAVYFVLRLFPSPSHRLSLVVAAVLGLAWPCLNALLDFVQTHNSRQFGAYLNPNWFANALAMGLPLALTLPVSVWSLTRQKTWAWLAVAPLGVILPGLVVTGSKGGFVAAGVALVVTVVALRAARKEAFNRLVRRLLPVIIIGGIVFALLVAKTVGPRLMQAGGADNNSTQFRAYLWRGTVKMIEAKPLLGHGPASFPTSYPAYALAGYTRTAHQSWLQIAAESGIPALLLLLSATGCAVVSGIKALRTTHWPLVAGALGCVAALLVHGCFDAGWNTASIAMLFAFSLALLEVPTLAETTTQEKEVGLGWSWLGATLVLALGGYGSQTIAQGEDASAESKRLFAQGAPSLALQRAQSAVSIDPGSARNWVQLGLLQATTHDADWKQSMLKAVALQPNRPQNYRNIANTYESEGNVAEVEAYEQKALDRDPLNTQLLLERAKARLDRKDGRGYQDLENILKLWNEPYGRYPALDEWVNLDFTRALVLLEPHLRGAQRARLSGWIQHALKDLDRARFYQNQNKAVLAAGGTDSSLNVNEDLDSLEAQVKALQSP